MKSRKVPMEAVFVLLVLAILALSAARPASALTVDVRLKDTLAFDPSTIRASPGESVMLRLINDGIAEHTFTLFKEKDAQVPLNDEQALREYNSTAEKIVDVHLNGGEEKTITFTAPTEPGTYVFVCMVPLHAVGGMHGVFIVGEEAGIPTTTIIIVATAVVVAVAAVVLVFLRQRKA